MDGGVDLNDARNGGSGTTTGMNEALLDVTNGFPPGR